MEGLACQIRISACFDQPAAVSFYGVWSIDGGGSGKGWEWLCRWCPSRKLSRDCTRSVHPFCPCWTTQLDTDTDKPPVDLTASYRMHVPSRSLSAAASDHDSSRCSSRSCSAFQHGGSPESCTKSNRCVGLRGYLEPHRLLMHCSGCWQAGIPVDDNSICSLHSLHSHFGGIPAYNIDTLMEPRDDRHTLLETIYSTRFEVRMRPQTPAIRPIRSSPAGFLVAASCLKEQGSYVGPTQGKVKQVPDRRTAHAQETQPFLCRVSETWLTGRQR